MNIIERLKETSDVRERLIILENELLKLLDDAYILPRDFRKMFKDLTGNNSWQINEFCRQKRISSRQLQRMYAKYIGLSASSYNTLNRFHGSLNQLLYGEYSKLSDLAYDNGYFDQLHFIKEIKRFTGNSPKSHVKQDNSILQIGKLS